MQLTRKQIHEQVYFYTLILLAISLPLSIFTTSMFMILLALNWMVEGRFAQKWKQARTNRALQVFLLFFLLHLVGLLWSENLSSGLLNLKIKLPLILMPVVLATSGSLSRRQVQRILLFFSLGVLVSSLGSMMKLAGWLPGEVNDFRELSLFMSHIRFSLMIVLSLLIAGYFLFVDRTSVSRAERIYYLVSLLWFVFFLLILKSLSGVIITLILTFFILLRLVWEIRDRVIRFMALVPVIMIPLFSVIYLGYAVERFYNFDELKVEELDRLTVEGNPYTHRTGLSDVENGHYTWIYLCDKELEREWSRVSEIPFMGGQTGNGNALRTTLIRFLTSEGLRKDAAGFRQLSEEDIRAIEQGVANCIYLDRFKFYPRVYELIWEIHRYRLGYDPNDKSVVQRYLFLEAGWNIARGKLLYGTGPGDMHKEFARYYESVDSPLEARWRGLAHNQYLTFLISLGIPGLLICLFALVAPLFLARRQKSFLAMGFLILILLSMFSMDTLERAFGAEFFAFFYSLFLFGPDFPWMRRKPLNGDE
ncbi:MAG: O-antigen ligase family protein [Bacteroidales bacterium]|nr:O-antigen ligase family protein [Bacteroidales bacterium]